jgi:hypothetical protein
MDFGCFDQLGTFLVLADPIPNLNGACLLIPSSGYNVDETWWKELSIALRDAHVDTVWIEDFIWQSKHILPYTTRLGFGFINVGMTLVQLEDQAYPSITQLMIMASVYPWKMDAIANIFPCLEIFNVGMSDLEDMHFISHFKHLKSIEITGHTHVYNIDCILNMNKGRQTQITHAKFTNVFPYKPSTNVFDGPGFEVLQLFVQSNFTMEETKKETQNILSYVAQHVKQSYIMTKMLLTSLDMESPVVTESCHVFCHLGALFHDQIKNNGRRCMELRNILK